jgi:aldose 1-epimerase
MLGASLRHHGRELLGRVDDLDGAAARGGTAGLPLLHPWANRLGSARYRAAGRAVALDRGSPLLHFDEHGLPMHGVPWARLAWEVVEATGSRLRAGLDWTRRDLLAIFPFPHRLELDVTLRPDGLTLDTTLEAGAEGPVPVSFGFHPYLGLPEAAPGRGRLRLPAMRRLDQDEHGIPTGHGQSFPGFDGEVDEAAFDDGFALLDERSTFALAGAGRRVSVELLGGYTHAQIFAPRGTGYVALEPMTAPTDALASGRALRLVEAKGTFRASFRIGVVEVSP